MNRKELDGIVLQHAFAFFTQKNEATEDRLHMAELAAFMLRRCDKDERVVTDAMDIAASCLNEPEVVRRLLAGIRIAAPDPDKLAIGLARLASRAFREGHDESLASLCVLMLRQSPWAEAVQEEWICRALAWALGGAVPQLRFAGILCGRWVTRRGTAAVWLQQAVQQHPAVLRYSGLSAETAGVLHWLAPTPESWRILWERQAGLLIEHSFGSRHGEAVDALAVAIADAPDGASRVGLARWYVTLLDGEGS